MTTTADTPALAARETQITIFHVMGDDSVIFNMIRRVVPGTEFSINTFRAELDAVGFPEEERQKSLRRAVSAGLCEYVKYFSVDLNRDVPKKVPSTGASAHGASVAVYRRLAPEDVR